MKHCLESIYNEICTCHNCNTRLSYRYDTNVYSGGPFYCGRCGDDVTEDVYGKPKEKQNETASTDLVP